MLTLHHLETSRSQRILWLLEELKVPYDIVHYQRNKVTRLAPPELKAIHPMGRSPVITDGSVTVAESAVILEYLAEQYCHQSRGELAGLLPAAGTAEYRQCRYWMHFAESSLMNSLVMKLIFTTIPTRPMPFFARPIARRLCARVLESFVDPNIANALEYINSHLASHTWFAGEALSVADFQMSFAVEAALARGEGAERYTHLAAYRERMVKRPAYQRAIEIGGPVIMS